VIVMPEQGALQHPAPLRFKADWGGANLLDAGGVDLAAIVARGGTVTRHEQPFDAVHDLREGRADLMVSEAIMTPDWQQLAAGRDVTFLSLSSAEAGQGDHRRRRVLRPRLPAPAG
jgi:hypothetical protein